jgi:hypothetical protein
MTAGRDRKFKARGCTGGPLAQIVPFQPTRPTGALPQRRPLLQPGTVLQSLFLVGSGVLSISRHEDESEIELLRLGPGDHFGEIALLMGTPSVATITALTPVTVFELPKVDLAPILEVRPQVAKERKILTLRCTISLFSGSKYVKKVSYPSPLCSSVRFMRSLTSPEMSHLKMADG